MHRVLARATIKASGNTRWAPKHVNLMCACAGFQHDVCIESYVEHYDSPLHVILLCCVREKAWL